MVSVKELSFLAFLHKQTHSNTTRAGKRFSIFKNFLYLNAGPLKQMIQGNIFFFSELSLKHGLFWGDV